MKKQNRISFNHLIVCIIITILFSSLSSKEKPAGEPWFQDAYRLEKHAKSFALELYQYAIKKDIEREMEKAAYWRIYLLQVKQQDYSAAYWTLLKIQEKKYAGKNIKKLFLKLHTQTVKSWQLSSIVVEEYYKLLRQLGVGFVNIDAQEMPMQIEDFFDRFVRNDKSRYRIVDNLINLSLSHDRSQIALDFITEYSRKKNLDLANVAIFQKQYSQAQKILNSSIVYSTTSGKALLGNRIRKNYLLGIAYREQGKMKKSNRYFYRAMKIEEQKNRGLYIDLVAYNYFLQEDYEAAYDILVSHKKNTKSSLEKNDATLLRLIIFYKKTKNRKFLTTLKHYRSYLRFRMYERKNPIIQQAWSMVDRSV